MLMSGKKSLPLNMLVFAAVFDKAGQKAGQNREEVFKQRGLI